MEIGCVGGRCLVGASCGFSSGSTGAIGGLGGSGVFSSRCLISGVAGTIFFPVFGSVNEIIYSLLISERKV